MAATGVSTPPAVCPVEPQLRSLSNPVKTKELRRDDEEPGEPREQGPANETLQA